MWVVVVVGRQRTPRQVERKKRKLEQAKASSRWVKCQRKSRKGAATKTSSNVVTDLLPTANKNKGVAGTYSFNVNAANAKMPTQNTNGTQYHTTKIPFFQLDATYTTR